MAGNKTMSGLLNSKSDCDGCGVIDTLKWLVVTSIGLERGVSAPSTIPTHSTKYLGK